MGFRRNSLLILLLVLLAAVGYGIYHTQASTNAPAVESTRQTPGTRTIVVDQSSLVTAEALVRLPTTADERSFAQDALRIANQEMDLAFASAVRQTANQNRPLSDEAKEIERALQQALKALAADESQVSALTAAAARAKPADAQPLADRLALARAQVALDQDQVDDARQDLRRAGGDPQGRMQAMMQEHDAASKMSDSVRINMVPRTEPQGLVRRVRALQALNDKERELAAAKVAADTLAVALKQRHDRLDARVAARRDSAQLSHDSSAALLALTQRLAQSEKARSSLDQRIENQHKLSDVYASWGAVIARQRDVAINRVLRGLAVILAIVLVGMLIVRWTDRLVRVAAMERRRAMTLSMIVRVALQVFGVLLILLVIFGPPDNLGTFLGLAGAGLTVALGDFIIGFLGWFVLMGKNGVRIGDLVEINGVTGEVVELGLFYTVLLETGSWSESGHPTGRRVTFTNGFAIQGHYFNFSTSGRWLWDDVRIIVPDGRDPYPIVEALQQQLEEATADSAAKAATEWKAAERSPLAETITSGPSIRVRPVAGGVEIDARYITHVAERDELRAKLYQTAVHMLGGLTPARALT